nr:MAG TPA: hypothetical protein [Caudoviricetes sp.]
MSHKRLVYWLFCYTFMFIRNAEECTRCCGLLQCCYEFQGVSRHFRVLTLKKIVPD